MYGKDPVCLQIDCLQFDCLHALLGTNKSFRNGVTFAYVYYCLHVLLPTSIIANDTVGNRFVSKSNHI